MIVVGGIDDNQRKRPNTIRVDLERLAPLTRVTVNATFPAVGEGYVSNKTPLKKEWKKNSKAKWS